MSVECDRQLNVCLSQSNMHLHKCGTHRPGNYLPSGQLHNGGNFVYVLPQHTACTPVLMALTVILLLGIATMNTTNSLCGIKPALDDSWFARDIVLLCLMLIVVIMRFLARATVDMPFWWDDWMNFVAVVSYVAAVLSRIPVNFIDDLTIRKGFCIGLNITSFQGCKWSLIQWQISLTGLRRPC